MQKPSRPCAVEGWPAVTGTVWPEWTDWPELTGWQMREVDRIMIEDLHIDLTQMMENAGRNLAEVAVRRFRPATATVLPAGAVTAAAGWSPPGTWPTGG